MKRVPGRVLEGINASTKTSAMLPILEALPNPLQVRLSGDLCTEAMGEQLAPLRGDTSSHAYVRVECEPDVQLRPAGVGPLYATLLNVIRHGTPLLFVNAPDDVERTARNLLDRLGTPHHIVFASNEAEASAAEHRLFLRIRLGLRIPLRFRCPLPVVSELPLTPISVAA